MQSRQLNRTLHWIAAGATAMGLLAANARAEVIELKVSHFLPPNHTFHKELLRWGEELAQKSDGRLMLKVFPAGQMGPPPRQFDLARTGVADLAIGLTGSTPGRFPLTELSNLPFMVNESARTSKALTELAPKYLASEFAGVKILYLMTTTPLKFHMASKKIGTMADFKGLRIRYAGEIFAASVKAFGAVPLAVQPGEVVDAMGKGTIDGALFPFEGAQSFQVGTVAKFSFEPGINAASFFLVMNPGSYDRLAPDLRALIDQTTGPSGAERIGRLLDDAEIEGRAYMTSKGVQIIPFSAGTQGEMQAAVKPVVEDMIVKLEAKGQPARALYDALLKAR
jgi:TRAP-type C4-dicarboxylate transport system substrate-binding protein